MKIIHAADLHLGSALTSSFSNELSTRRRIEIAETYRRLVGYAAQNGVAAVLFSGDVFDSDYPRKNDVNIFLGEIRNHPEIDFYVIKGNHDLGDELDAEIPANLHRFGSEWKTYDLGENITVSGIDMIKENSVSLYSSLLLDRNSINIVMLHGEISARAGLWKISLERLKDKNIDYLALGHIHKPSEGRLDDRGVYAYSGCLEGRGYDETGPRGFRLIEIENGKLSSKFVPFAKRTIEELSVDISSCHDGFDVEEKIRKDARLDPSGIYRIHLIGELEEDAEFDVESIEEHLKEETADISIKDETGIKVDISRYENENSLAGEFVRMVKSSDLPEDEKPFVLAYGLRALLGKEIGS